MRKTLTAVSLVIFIAIAMFAPWKLAVAALVCLLIQTSVLVYRGAGRRARRWKERR